MCMHLHVKCPKRVKLRKHSLVGWSDQAKDSFITIYKKVYLFLKGTKYLKKSHLNIKS